MCIYSIYVSPHYISELIIYLPIGAPSIDEWSHFKKKMALKNINYFKNIKPYIFAKIT